ncbi:bifunctional [glutamate--ammonia ligase]-adenylyl-L-tyrosine phosphorylase/[glutamate--ammonia-ligase] adenylyltransferase [Thiomicrorhabdus sp. Milos-T2]|uniref:bifunctional [glutamate--ammonia ligase]-adenylyl-L-tyrosine phosphorylase/[glutamate--ammonia-ligase] adenylyltransferase n=1 Tax=Thiomicrorhabdus sp. Milos-T2 TaxID=90814 RepID=UPI00056DB458|nr:bifunctional [glutamate--ammonia ligase]-adenylyl-L-tyrosine phosphorylase/[glutamate--ammonia-ligase] adenylyltransferase [Thiomicrorhabdus sp. Milos-T2]
MPHSIEKVLNWSPFVERLTQRYPDLLESSSYEETWAQGSLYERVYSKVFSAESEAELLEHLRVQRNWMMGRIALRDLMQLSVLVETVSATSELADALVSAALDWHYARFCHRYGTPIGRESGEPQKLIVIGMGKLGGQELNFSSDIDLIFTYPEGGETEGGAKNISNDQFFIRLGQALNKSLVEVTNDGFVYRVDMRLRPFGDAGPLAVNFSSLEHYYEIHGRAWERYALVKARVMAGDKNKGEELFEILRPFVYRRYVDFSAMDSLRELKQMIVDQVAKKGMVDNIKLGTGGIREIEFIAQAFQLVHGGRDKMLQTRSLLPTLKVLNKHEFLENDVYENLVEAYRFLRTAENRLQMWGDQQTHSLPTNDSQQCLLANSMGFNDYSAFYAVLNEHRAFVESQFKAVFAQEKECDVRDDMSVLWSSEFNDWHELEALGVAEDLAKSLAKALNDFKTSRQIKTLSKEGIERLDEVMPFILKALISPNMNLVTLQRVLSVVESIAKRSVYLVLIKENSEALEHLVGLCEASAWLTEMLVKYPALLDQLLDECELYSPLRKDDLQSQAFALLQETGLDEEVFMDKMRQWRHAQVFKVAAADLMGHLPLMKVSDYLTWVAEAVVNVSVEFAWQLMQKRSGLPGGLEVNSPRNPFMVLGYGKLGGLELGFGSDLDVVFVYQGVGSSEQTINANGKTLDNAIYFIRMGQKVISLLSTVMPSGRLYEVDTRLRPNGNSGMLVTDFNSYMQYIENKAWNWEYQALVRARAVVGDDESVNAFDSFRTTFLTQVREVNSIRQSVVEMRQKMKDSLDKSSNSVFDLKQGEGGIVDIEFMMQFLVLSYANKYPELAVYTDNVRILEVVAKFELLSAESVSQLTEAYKVYREKYHRMALANENPLVSNDSFVENRKAVKSVWNDLFLT